jgi:hypothetical protein
MKITDVMEFCDLILAQYGNMDVIVFTENAERVTYTFNEPVLELLQIPVSRFSDKNKLVTGFGFGKDLNFMEDEKIKSSAKQKTFLRLIK